MFYSTSKVVDVLPSGTANLIYVPDLDGLVRGLKHKSLQGFDHIILGQAATSRFKIYSDIRPVSKAMWVKAGTASKRLTVAVVGLQSQAVKAAQDSASQTQKRLGVLLKTGGSLGFAASTSGGSAGQEEFTLVLEHYDRQGGSQASATDEEFKLVHEYLVRKQ